MSGLKDRRHVSDLAREIERLVAQGELWPGFDPLAIPLVFYDGDDTYLFRCSEVPEGFREMRVVDLPREGYAANEVRGRCYEIGHALAVLLDAFAPIWKTAFEADDAQALDLYLAGVLEKSGRQCGEFTESEIAHFEAVARVDVQDLLAQRSEQRRAFDSQVGMRLSVIAPDTEPLWVSGTDPSNLVIVEGGVLHTRFVHIHHERGQVEMLTDRMDDVVALTVAVGPHPLMDGVLWLTIAGLDTLDVVSDDGAVNISGSGLTAQFTNATVDENDGQITVYLDKQN